MRISSDWGSGWSDSWLYIVSTVFRISSVRFIEIHTVHRNKKWQEPKFSKFLKLEKKNYITIEAIFFIPWGQSSRLGAPVSNPGINGLFTVNVSTNIK